jgi:hypothetical protein
MAADGPGHLCDRKDIQGRQGQLPDDRFAALVAEELERTCRWPSRLMGIAERLPSAAANLSSATSLRGLHPVRHSRG